MVVSISLFIVATNILHVRPIDKPVATPEIQSQQVALASTIQPHVAAVAQCEALVMPPSVESRSAPSSAISDSQTDHFYMGSIMNEINLFQKELQDLRNKCNNNNVTDIGRDEEMTQLKRDTEQMTMFSKEIKQLTNVRIKHEKCFLYVYNYTYFDITFFLGFTLVSKLRDHPIETSLFGCFCNVRRESPPQSSECQ